MPLLSGFLTGVEQGPRLGLAAISLERACVEFIEENVADPAFGCGS
jgi:hypothetical protein